MTGSTGFWEEVAQRRWGRYISEAERRFILEAVRDEPVGHLLDIGCGGARWSRMLADRGWSVTGVDVDPSALAVARARVPSARFHQVVPSSESLPVAARSVSLLLCIEVPVIGETWFLPEASRVLAPGGLLVATVWNSRSARGVAARTIERLREGREHDFYRRSFSAWRRDLHGHGFRVTAAEGLCWSPFGRRSNSPLVPAAIRLERMARLSRLTSLSPWVLVAARRATPANPERSVPPPPDGDVDELGRPDRRTR